MPSPRDTPGYHPKTSEVGTDLRAFRTADIGAFREIALPPEASLKMPSPRNNPGYRPKTSEVGTDLRAVRTADMALSEKSPYPGSLPENAKPAEQPQLSPEDLPGRDRSPSGPAPQTLALSEKSPYPQPERCSGA